MNIYPIETGFFSTDGGAMFGIVSKKVWSGKYASDGENRCPLAMRALFVDFGERKVLFDTGAGIAKVSGMSYYRFHDLKSVRKELERHGYSPEEVTDVVLSHLHFDHCGGCAVTGPDGKLYPAFPNALYWAGKRQWDLTLSPSLWEEDSFAPSVMKAINDAGLLRLVNTDTEIFSGLSVRLMQGHTEDQLVSYITTPYGTLVYCGDVIPMSTHVMPLCIAAVDNSAEISVNEKMKLLEEAVEKDQILFFFHDAVNKAVRLKKLNGRISVKTAFNL